MLHGAEYRRCLEELDFEGIRRLFAHTDPHLPQPRSDAEALATLHIARTATATVPTRLRCYSHSWLTERGLPSQLPDRLKAMADRLYPHVTPAVGIACKAKLSEFQPVSNAIASAMGDAVMEAAADGKLTDSPYVKGRMLEARHKTVKQLLGKWGFPNGSQKQSR